MINSKILVVEDEAITAKDLQYRLKKFGYIVAAIASSGEEAINKAIEISPDLVLMDIKLQGTMDGIQAAQEIYKRLDIPVIYLTAYADDKILERAKITEPFSYLLKPFEERELQTNIEIALTKHSLEKQLKASKKWLDALLKSIGDGVIASDLQELITFMNPVAENLTGWKQEEACGRKLSEIFNIANAETHHSVKSPIKQALQDGTIVDLLAGTILITKDGAEIPIDDSAAPIKDDKDNITGAVLVFRDVSERKQAIEAHQKQIEQEQLVEKLEEMNQLKNDFLNLVSHELRSPLNNLKMMIQMLQLSPDAQETQRYLELMETECDSELELINNLLDLQRLESSSAPVITPDALFLQEWIPWIIKPFQIRIQEHQQTLQMNLPANLPPLFSDGISLERIIVELLNNACKYTLAGGKIIISVDYDSSELPAKTIITTNNSAEIPAIELPRIFDKFYRLSNADIWNQGGSGLGLPIVQKLVEQLQGKIQVESGNGSTTFTLTLTDL